MAPLPERVFDPARLVYVRRPFVAAGRHLDVGTEFKWRQWAIDLRRVRQLFDNGKLMHRDTAPAPDWAGLQARESDVSPATTAPAIEQEVQDEDAHHAAVTAPPPQDTPAEEQPAGAPTGEPADELDDLDEMNLKQLRAVADSLGVPYRTSRQDQRDDIRARRRELAAG